MSSGLCSGGSHCACRKFSRAQSPGCGCSSAPGKPSHSCQHSRMSVVLKIAEASIQGGTASSSSFSYCTSCGHVLLPSGKTQHEGIQPLGMPQAAFWELGAVMSWEVGLHNVPSAVTPFKPVRPALLLQSTQTPRPAEQDQAAEGFSWQVDEILPWGPCWTEPEEDGRVAAAGFWVRVHLVSSQ